MKKIIYYLRMTLFTIYLITLFLLIDNFYNINIITSIYFILNIVYSLIIILSILSKKKIFKNPISYNILNIGIYIYTIVIYIITSNKTKLEIMNNNLYFNNNFIMLSILLLGLSIYSLYLNNTLDNKKSDKEIK